MTGDPFFDELHRLQPDVDIVVLPPQVPLERAPADSDAVATAARATSTTVTDLLDAAGLQADRSWSKWRRRSDGLHEHRTRSRVASDDEEAAVETFAVVGETLAGWGWAVRPVQARSPWVVADTGSMSVDVAVEGRHLVVTATSSPLNLPEARG